MSSDATRSETKTTSMKIPIRDGAADLGLTGDGAGPAPLGDWSLFVDPALALGGGESVSGAGDGPAPAASSDRHNANRSPRSRLGHIGGHIGATHNFLWLLDRRIRAWYV